MLACPPSMRVPYPTLLKNLKGPRLLLHLIQKAKVNIYDIPIAQITQFLEYLKGAEELSSMCWVNFTDGSFHLPLYEESDAPAKFRFNWGGWGV